MSASALSNYPGGFAGGVTLRGMPVLNSHSGKVFWVDSNATTAGRGTFDSPFTTIDRCFDTGIVRANKGDVVMVKAGHTEAITAAAGLVFDVAGVAVVFLGEGATRARITFGTAVGADLDVDAANVTLVNPLFVSALDALTGPIDVNAADFTIVNGEYRDAAAMAATDCIVADAGADRMTIDGWRFVDSTTGTQKQSNIQIAAADDVILKNIDIVGDFGTGAIENGTAWVNALLDNVNINNTAAGPVVTILLQATSTGTMRNSTLRVASGTTYLTANNDMQFFETFGTGTDATAGEKIGTLVAGDVETKVDTTLTRIGTEAATDPLSEVLSGTGGITTWKNAATPATGVSMSEVLRDVWAVLNGTAAGENGVQSWPAAAAAGNGVSLSEALRYVQDRVAAAMLNRNATNYLSVATDFTSATWNTVAAHEILTVTGACHIIILPQITTTITSTGGLGTLILGDETTTNSLITLTVADDLAAGEWWFDATATRTLAAKSIFEKTDFVVAAGKDIGYTVATAALTAGVITFHVWWEPIDATGAVAAGAGGVL